RDPGQQVLAGGRGPGSFTRAVRHGVPPNLEQHIVSDKGTWNVNPCLTPGLTWTGGTGKIRAARTAFSRGGMVAQERKVGSVTYREVDRDYFEKRGLKRHAGMWSLWALGV